VGQLFALDSNKQISQYAHTAWRLQDGIFSGSPYVITQTADGYLWIGTRNGLVRFDGVRFVPWTAPDGAVLPATTVISLLGASDGSLWIGTEHGLSHWASGRLTNYLNGRGQIAAIVEDHNHEIWVTRTRTFDGAGPVCRIRGTDAQCYGIADGLPLDPCCTKEASALYEDRAGNLWIGNEIEAIRWGKTSSTAYKPIGMKSNAGLDGVVAIAADQNGTLWIGTAVPRFGLGLQHLENGVLKPFSAPGLAGSNLEALSLLSDHDNNLWIGTLNHGLYRILGRKVDHFGSADGLSSDSVYQVYQDREGTLWCVTSKGIDAFHDIRVSSFSTREGLGNVEVDTVLATRDGTVWAGGLGALDGIRADGTSIFRIGNGLPGHQITSLFEDHAGFLWIGVDRGIFLYRNGRFAPISEPDGSPVGLVVGITEDTEYNIWIEISGTPRKLIRIRDLKVRDEFPDTALPAARKIDADLRDGIWLGLMNGNLARYRHGKVDIFPFQHATDFPVNQLMVNADGSVFGATGYGVIAWKDGKTQTLSVRNGLPCNAINAFIRDNQDSLWLYTQCALVRIPDAELQRWWKQPDTKLEMKTFDGFDGVQPGWAPFEGAAKSRDGRLWFANGVVLQMVDPVSSSGNTLAPPINIEGIIADRQRHSPHDALQLPPHTRDLEIDYTALSFVVPQKVHFRYKLEGRDEDWQEAGMRRQAFYSDLRPGKYRFHVIACNNDGVWNDKGAALDFSVLPAMYQTAWFRVACILTGIFIFWAFYRLRTYQIHAAISTRFEERLAERTRLARELHDTLLQTIQGSKMIVDDLLDPPAVSGRPREVMGRLSGALAQALLELRTSLNSLRNATASGNDLAEAFRRAADDCANRGVTDIAFIVEGTACEMRPIVRDEIYRIGHEGIRNACQHSGADRIEVRLSYGENLVFSVHDDGRGIDPEVAVYGKSDHFGLQGMRERAKHCCGTLTISSSKDSGTRVELMIPGDKVFLNGHPTWRTLLMKIRRNIPGTNWRSDVG